MSTEATKPELPEDSICHYDERTPSVTNKAAGCRECHEQLFHALTCDLNRSTHGSNTTSPALDSERRSPAPSVTAEVQNRPMTWVCSQGNHERCKGGEPPCKCSCHVPPTSTSVDEPVGQRNSAAEICAEMAREAEAKMDDPSERGWASFSTRVNALREAEKRIRAATPEAASAMDVFEMRICEVPHVGLRPDQLYRFTVAPGCEACERAVAPLRCRYEYKEGRVDGPPKTLSQT